MNRQEQPHLGDLESLITPRLKKLTMMRAPARIGFCLTYWVWREPMPMVSNATHRNGREEKKTGHCYEQYPTECHDHRTERIQTALHRPQPRLKSGSHLRTAQGFGSNDGVCSHEEQEEFKG
jgi:hypothetical protein